MDNTLYKIPMANTPERFILELEGRSFEVVCRWNDAEEGGWLLDWYEEDAPIIMNMPLVTGANLLEPYTYLGLSGVLAVLTDGSDAPPSIASLGNGSELYYLTAEAAA